MEKDQLDGLLALKLVAEMRSFTAASEELRVSPPAISKMISQLEKKMGITFLTRTTRTVSLTEAGQRFLDQAAPAIDQILFAQEDVKNFAKKPSGVLKLNMPGTVYSSFLSPFVQSFAEKYPDVTIDIHSADQASDIFERGFDAGIRDSDILAKDMVALKLAGPIHYVTVASPKYLNKRGRPKNPKDLLEHNCIRHRFGVSTHIYDNWEFESKGKEFAVRISGSLIFNDSLLVLKSAKEGAGIAYLTLDLVKDDIKAGNLELVLNSFKATSEGYYLYFPRVSQVSPKLRAFIDHFKEMKEK